MQPLTEAELMEVVNIDGGGFLHTAMSASKAQGPRARRWRAAVPLPLSQLPYAVVPCAFSHSGGRCPLPAECLTRVPRARLFALWTGIRVLLHPQRASMLTSLVRCLPPLRLSGGSFLLRLIQAVSQLSTGRGARGSETGTQTVGGDRRGRA